MVVEHLPSPKEAQEYRVPNIWDGEIDSPAGECMINTSPDGPLAVMVTNVSVDKHAGEIATVEQSKKVLKSTWSVLTVSPEYSKWVYTSVLKE